MVRLVAAGLGVEVPAALEKIERFYAWEGGRQRYWDLGAGALRDVPVPQGIVDLELVRRAGGVVEKGPEASVLDLGDGVFCLELHSKKDAIGEDIVRMVTDTLRSDSTAVRDFEAFVITGDGANFSVGANLMQLLLSMQEGEWDELALGVRQFQNTVMSLRYSPKPVVVAPHHLTLGGGCEFDYYRVECKIL